MQTTETFIVLVYQLRRLRTPFYKQVKGSTAIAPQQQAQQQQQSQSLAQPNYTLLLHTQVPSVAEIPQPWDTDGGATASSAAPTLVRSDTAVKLRSGVDLHFPRHRARDARRSGSVHCSTCMLPGSRHMIVMDATARPTRRPTSYGPRPPRCSKQRSALFELGEYGVVQ